MNKKGFTLVELLATIVVLAVISIITTVSVVSFMNNSKNKTNDIVTKNLEDAALTYGLTLSIPNSCAVSYIVTNVNDSSLSSNCMKKVTVNKLIQDGFFKDDKNNCNGSTTLGIYKYKSVYNGKDIYDIKVVVPNNVCNR